MSKISDTIIEEQDTGVNVYGAKTKGRTVEKGTSWEQNPLSLFGEGEQSKYLGRQSLPGDEKEE